MQIIKLVMIEQMVLFKKQEGIHPRWDQLTKPLLSSFLSTSVLVLPPSVISMEPADSQCVVARGIGVMPAGHDLFNSSEYGLMLRSGLVLKHLFLINTEKVGNMKCMAGAIFILLIQCKFR